MTKCASHRNQKRRPTFLRSGFRVHHHPSCWSEPREKDRVLPRSRPPVDRKKIEFFPFARTFPQLVFLLNK